MKSDLDTLRITQDQLEILTKLDISKTFMGGIARPSALRSPRQLVSFLITEFSVLAVVFIVCFGGGLVIVRNGATSGQLPGLLLGAGSITLGVAIAWNGYQWHRYKTLKTLAHLLDEVDRHNDIIQAIQVLDELDTVRPTSSGLNNRSEITTALAATRDSLVSALRTEQILRHHHHVLQQRQELISSLESNLAALQSLHVNNQASEYQQFLQEALEIGMAVQQEMQFKATVER